MKSGVRALGLAESFSGRDDAGGPVRSTIAGAVVRADCAIDGLRYAACTVGGTDATDAVRSLVETCCRPDVRYVLLGAVAPAWYNLLDLSRIHDAAERPVLAVTFEASDGLEAGLRDAFSGDELDERLATYRSLPDRRAVSVNGEIVYVRCLGCDRDEAGEIVRGFTPAGGRPEPIRVAGIAARAADEYAAGDRE
ncbi:DUF99 family protein [Halosolutus gelatinilyticus]|uniref:endonuclease dU n=1 Tax=Halosolutus gelatinilyticus TaxID=2931975 RepID=UPI001FF2651C|nr:DUF99 family protein [Halosolutus gelatinilyticus]